MYHVPGHGGDELQQEMQICKVRQKEATVHLLELCDLREIIYLSSMEGNITYFIGLKG